MKRNKKGLIPILVMMLVAIVATVFISIQKGKLLTGSQQTNQNISVMQSTSDLDNVASELDDFDLDAVDNELDQLDSDASIF